jgi:phage baseplate assembly protein V
MDMPPDVPRLIGDLLRLGTIASVDLSAATCTVTAGDVTTGDLPWLAWRAGDVVIWCPPTIGEQVMLLCPEGDVEAGLVLPGVYSTANPAPSDQAHLFLVRFGDQAALSYDADAHALVAQLPGAGTARVVAPGGMTIEGPVTIKGPLAVQDDIFCSGNVTADGDVTAEGTSLKNHIHAGVTKGKDTTLAPV